MAAKRLVCNLQCPQKKFHLTSLAVLLIHFIALLPHICHSLDILPEIVVGQKCDIFTGSWVHDESWPLYDWTKCPYISGEFNSQKNGRPDLDFQKWRWQPLDCKLNRFNALDFLQRLRGKKILFAGDSLTNEQWQSMVCLLSSVLPPGRTTLSAEQGLSAEQNIYTFKALDYGVSVSFQWAPFLVDRVNKVIGGQQKVVVQLDSVELNAKGWVGQDILHFESGHWWGYSAIDPRYWDYMQDGPNLYEDMHRMVAYRKGLTTWANWIDSNIDTAKTRVFYRSFSGTHFSARDWQNTTGHNCQNETEPILGSSYPGPYPPQLQVGEDVVKQMSSNVSFLNITTLTLLRKDGHPSIYTTDHLAPGSADCLHWCLPGVPDAWNELLYSSLFF